MREIATNVFDLTAKLGLDTSEYERALDSAAKKMKDFEGSNENLGKSVKGAGDKSEESKSKIAAFGSAMKTVAGKTLEAHAAVLKFTAAASKITAKALIKATETAGVAVGATTAGIIKLTKDAVTAYGEYEQLVGGAQKIFDEMDYSVIAKDAANAYKELNMSASQYIESINLAGATFAQTMGDAKGYETARKGMKAIADFASGTGKSIDVLNEKFQMITRSTSSYQSIADQFSGILPQTSADFLEQAQAAGFLSENYTKLTDVPVAEYQEAVTNMLEKGVDALGLLNNTAKESTDTLTGSFAMVKASWQNLVTGFADPNADLGQLIDNFTESAEAAFTNLLPTIEKAIGGISEFISTIAPKIAEDLPGIINDILPNILTAATTLVQALGSALLENAPLILDTALTLLEDLLTFLTNIDNDPEADQKIESFLTQIGDTLHKHLPKILEMAIDLVLKVFKGIALALPSIVQELLSFLDDNLDTIVEGITELIPIIIEAVLKIMLAVAEWLTDNMDLVIESIIKIEQAIYDALISENAISKLIQAAAMLVAAFLTEVINHLPELLDLGISIITAIFGGIWDALTTLTDPITDWLSDKLLELTGWIDDRITDIANFGSDFLDSLKESLTGNNPIADWLADVLLDFTSWIEERITDIKNFGKNLWTSLKESLSGNNPIADWLSDVWIDATEAIGKWWDDVKQWGSDLVSNFIEGVEDMWDSLKETFSDYGELISDFIGFSEPSKGELSHFHEYAPDMVDLFIKGIKDNEDKVGETLSETFGMDTMNATGEAAITANNSVLVNQLERILQAINAGRVIAIDGDKLVGATVGSYDTQLGTRTVYSERGLANVV